MNRGHAIVIGGGVVGLLAAHVVQEHFERITIIDRDRFPEQPNPRRGVPQGRHMHILMARGLRAFEQLLPGLRAQLSAAGAGLFDFAADTALCFPTGWMPRFSSGIEVHACTRDLLEYTLRRRVLAPGRIETVQGTAVTDLTTTEDGTSIRAVQLTDGTLGADLIIDASGRGSRAPQWLHASGYSAVAETIVEAPIDYGSRWYEVPAERRADWRLLAISPRYPDIRRGGTIIEVEGGRWNVLLLGLDGERVPTDEAGFREFARSLASPRLFEAIESAHPVSDIHRYRNNDNRIRHYERMEDGPSNFIALGDAAYALNPYAGLGMTSGALGVLALQQHLHECAQRGDWSRFGRRFAPRLVAACDPAWEIATNQHLRWPDEPSADASPRPPLPAYLARLMRMAVREPDVSKVVLEVMHMLAPARDLFTPALRRRLTTEGEAGEARKAEART